MRVVIFSLFISLDILIDGLVRRMVEVWRKLRIVFIIDRVKNFGGGGGGLQEIPLQKL